MQLFLFYVIIYYMEQKLRTIKKEEEYYFEEKKSKFFSFIFPIYSEEDAKNHLSNIRKKFSDARHILWAYSINGCVKKNNDGEPTGAQAILNAITMNSIDNVVVIVVRYFGGILLGAGGLFRAYGNGANEVIKKCEILNMNLYNIVEVCCDYNSYLSLQKKYKLLNCEYSANVVLTFALTDIELKEIEGANLNYKIIGEKLL